MQMLGQEGTGKSAVESDACTNQEIQQTQWGRLHCEPFCVALSNLAILIWCPEIVSKSWQSSKPNASIPEKVSNMLFLYLNWSQILGSDNRVYFYLHACPGDIWKWREMPDNSSWCETILESLSPSQMSALAPTHCNVQKCRHQFLCGQRPKEKVYECAWKQESKEKDKQWAIPREALYSI